MVILMNQPDDFIYCFNRKCTLKCARNDSTIGFGMLYLREQYKQDKNGKCEHYVPAKEE